MYRGLIGPYPYGKFALVENFWETGYGMPSYTLLGPQVIRFPFILTSSYPHEILHNWWGNSVFVDYESGNWCEGLTAYMADHLIQEQRGRGEEYRRDTLQKYRSYVRDGRDFPLTEFRSRHSAATEAVGYGKTLMVFHMMRQRIGDEAFRKWAARFYREYRGKQASFADVRKSLEAVAGAGPRPVLRRPRREARARPRLQATLSDLRESTGGGFEVAFVIEQTQPGAPLLLDVPVVVQTAGEARAPPRCGSKRASRRPRCGPRRSRWPSTSTRRSTSSACSTRARRPPRSARSSASRGSWRSCPSQAPAAEQDGYRKLIEGWKSDSHQPEIRTDAEVAELPKDRAVWLLGRTNALAAKLFASGGDYTLDGAEARGRPRVDAARRPLGGDRAPPPRQPREGDRLDLRRRHGRRLPGLGRKLPHYGKYSYLGFEGDEPVNVLKGQWTATDSPLRVDLRPNAERAAAVAALALPARKALAELPPVFSQKALLDHVAWLSAPSARAGASARRGSTRRPSTSPRPSRRWACSRAATAGRTSSRSRRRSRPRARPVTLRNVIGVLPGSKAEWAGQSALLTAHYDHLGLGWPDVHKGDEGKLHPGADDNASGVAVMLELAKALASGEKPQRTIVFVAFTGEESGLLGSKHYVEHPAFPLEKTIGVINLDTVGRLFDKKVSVLATGSASEWQHIFRGAGFVTGVEGRMIPDALESSDQKSFIDRGVPAVQIFTDPHAGLPPARRHRRQDRRPRAREGGDLREGGDRLPRRARAAAHEHDRVDEGRARRRPRPATPPAAPAAAAPARAGASASARCRTSRSPAPA